MILHDISNTKLHLRNHAKPIKKVNISDFRFCYSCNHQNIFDVIQFISYINSKEAWNCINWYFEIWNMMYFFHCKSIDIYIILTYYIYFSNSFNYLVILLDFIKNAPKIHRIIWWCLRSLYGVLLSHHAIPFYNSFSSRFYMIPPFFTYDTSVVI